MAARATTETGAANQALGHLGQPELADLGTDTTKRARTMRRFFGTARDAILREKWWSFAKGWVRPAMDGTPSFGHLKNRFALPASVLRVRFLQDCTDDEWDLEGGDITDLVGVTSPQVVLVTNATQPLVCVTNRVENVALWDAVMLDGFAYELASLSARDLGRSGTRATELHQMALETIDKAAAIDSKEQSRKKANREGSWVSARHGFRRWR